MVRGLWLRPTGRPTRRARAKGAVRPAGSGHRRRRPARADLPFVVTGAGPTSITQSLAAATLMS